jgi:hypothetical protein
MIVESGQGSSEMIRLLARKLRSWTLTDEHRNSICLLAVSVTDPVTPVYTRPRAEWTTVTPIILHGHNALRGQISLAKTEKLLFQAFEKGDIAPSKIALLRVSQIVPRPPPFGPLAPLSCGGHFS